MYTCVYVKIFKLSCYPSASAHGFNYLGYLVDCVPIIALAVKQRKVNSAQGHLKLSFDMNGNLLTSGQRWTKKITRG
jgi:hypothetical protein